MTLGWTLRRLAGMSPREVIHRLSEQGKRAASRRRRYGWEEFPAPGPLRPLPDLADTLRDRATSALRAAIRASAEAILAGRFRALGVAWPERSPDDLFPAALWRLDPVSNLPWPDTDRFTFDVPYRHRPDRGDVKYVWEINRLQVLQPLAARVALDGDARAAAAIETAVASWAAANPPFRGLAWNSGIELALRAVSLIVAASLCGDRLGAATRARIAAILAAHAYWLARYPSRFSSANNHRVAEALGLVAIAAALPEACDAATAMQVLDEEALLQILPDGIGAEQSPTYAAFTAEMLIVAGLFADARGAPLSGAVGERLARFAEAIAWFCAPDARVAAIGDDDGGRVLTLCGPAERAYPASVARLAAGLRGASSAVPVGRDGPQWREVLAPAPQAAPPPLGLRDFAEGGYAVLRERRAGRDLHVVLDHGPLGYLSIAAHGHADANALTLSVDGIPVLVDPGTYLYHSGGAWRTWFRGTRAHNTLAVGGVDSSVMAGPFNWSRKARARLDERVCGPSWRIAASHDGYRRRFGVVHRRLVEATPRGFAIRDTLEGRAAPPSVVCFQFAPGLRVEGEGLAWQVSADDRPLLRLVFSAPGLVTVAAGGAIGEGGWVSPAFGETVPAPRLVWRGPVPSEGLRTAFDIA